MTHDPVLCRLIADVDRATAALRAYAEGVSTETMSDLVLLKDAETEYGKSNRQVRRWATEENLGEFINNKWYLRRSLVRRHKLTLT